MDFFRCQFYVGENWKNLVMNWIKIVLQNFLNWIVIKSVIEIVIMQLLLKSSIDMSAVPSEEQVSVSQIKSYFIILYFDSLSFHRNNKWMS